MITLTDKMKSWFGWRAFFNRYTVLKFEDKVLASSGIPIFDETDYPFAPALLHCKVRVIVPVWHRIILIFSGRLEVNTLMQADVTVSRLRQKSFVSLVAPRWLLKLANGKDWDG